MFKSTHADHPVDFSHATFLGSANFAGFNFEAGVSFINSIFHSDIQFSGSNFADRADFTRTRFEGRATFTGSQFNTPTTFIDAVFVGDANFGSFSPMSTTKFERAVFLRSKFMRPASFREVVFAKDSDFVAAEFNELCDFNFARFEGETRFDQVRFHKAAIFSGCKLEAIVTFRGREGEPVFFGEANFANILLERKDVLRFVQVDLSRVRFHDSDVLKMEFVGSRWARIGNRVGIYEEILLSQKDSVASLHDVETLYRELKQNHEERRDFARAGDFHVGEKEMRLRNQQTPVNLRVLLALSKITSQYGESFLKPLFWLIGIIVYVALFSILGGLTETNSKRFLDIFAISDWGKAILFAFDKCFHLPGEYFVPYESVRVLQTLAGIMGPLLIALLALAIRNKLRR